MSVKNPDQHRERDLDNRDEVHVFVTRFYRQIAQDERFHLYFDTIAHVDWNAHTHELADFWCGLLFGDDYHCAEHVIESHRWLHDHTPFDDELFDRWLEIFDSTLDCGWEGPVTEQARKRGHGFAWAMSKRLIGNGIDRS